MNNQNIGFKHPQNWHFSKGLVHGFGQKFEILLTFRFIKIRREKVFGDVLLRKQAFLNNINMDLKKRQTTVYQKRKIRYFPKGLVHRFCQKFEISSTLIFMQNRARKGISGNVLVRKSFYNPL